MMMPKPPNKDPLLPSFTTDVVVENSGSTARDNLANERTFLAWLRTGVSMIGPAQDHTWHTPTLCTFSLGALLSPCAVCGTGLGLALAKFTTGLTSEVGGLLFISVGIILIAFTGRRYFQVANALRRGEFPTNVAAVTTILMLFLMVGLACLFFILYEG